MSLRCCSTRSKVIIVFTIKTINTNTHFQVRFIEVKRISVLMCAQGNVSPVVVHYSNALGRHSSTRISPVVILLTTHMDSHRLLGTCSIFLLYFNDLKAEAKAVSSCNLVKPSITGRMRTVRDADVTVSIQYFMFHVQRPSVSTASPSEKVFSPCCGC